MLAMERPGTLGAAGTSAGSPPSNLSNNVALSFTLIVLLSNDAVNVEATAAGLNWLSASRVRSATNHEAFHEPTRPWNCSLPWESGAEDARTPNATAWSIDSAAKVPLLGGVRGGFMVPMHVKKRKRAPHEPQSPNPNDDSRNPKEHRNPRDETADRTPTRRSTFELRISFVICNSSFVIQ